MSILNTDVAYYNDHGEEHLKRVAENYADIVSSSLIDLSSCELFLALLSIWLHDLGLFLGRKPEEDPVVARKEHYKRVRDAIDCLENERNIAAMNLHHKELVIIICEGHSRNTNLSSIADSISLYGENIRLQMLASILRVADALDIDQRRTPESIFKLYEESIPAKSIEHWKKSFAITGIRINPQYASVDVYVILNEHNLQTLIHQRIMLNEVYDTLRNEIDSVDNVFSINRIPLHHVRLLDGRTNKTLETTSARSRLTITTLEQDLLVDETLNKFEEILKTNSGECRIILQIKLANQSMLTINLPPIFSILPDNTVFSQIRDILKPIEIDVITIPDVEML